MKFNVSDVARVTVVVVESNSSIRMLITEVLRGLGFPNPYGVSTGKEALSILEVEKVHWLIMPLMATEPVNAMQILKLIVTIPELNGIATTLLIDKESEDYCLPLAFELGLLSFQPKASAKDSLQNELQELMRILSANKGNVTLTAADYLRRHLAEKKLFKSRLALEQSLMGLFPGMARILPHLAEAEILAGNGARAAGLLAQAEILDEKLAVACRSLREKYLKQGLLTADDSRENLLGVENVLVIDSDSGVIRTATEILNQLGVQSIHTFDDGQDTFEWLIETGQSLDLIIMEWRIPGMSGPVLIQRLRQADFFHVPIIVASSQIKKDEKPLLMEMGVDEILEKPFDKASFLATVVWAIQQDKMPTEQKALEIKFRRLLAQNKHQESELILAQIVGDARVNEGTKKSLQAEFAMSLSDYSKACSLGVEAMRLGGDSLPLLNLIGKCLLKLGQYEKALQCFEKANSICSVNIERLLTMAEINVQLDHVDDAREVMAKASDLDPDNPDIIEMKRKIEVEIGDIDKARKCMEKVESVPRFASYINNRAVALAKSGRYEDGIKLYQKAIDCLKDKWADLSYSVLYNLALSYTRNADYPSAIDVLKELSKNTEAQVHKKAKALLRKVELAAKSGEKLHIPADDLEIATGDSKQEKFSPTSLKELMAKLEANRGDIGCYLVYKNVESVDPKASALLNDTLKFTKRVLIAKEKVAQPVPK